MDQLAGHALDHLEQSEPALVGTDLGIKHHLKQHVTQFLDDGRVVARIDRLEQLIGLLKRVRLDRLKSLLAVPRTTVGPTKHGDDLAELLQSREQQFKRGRFALWTVHRFGLVV